jgi:hypothetical protein
MIVPNNRDYAYSNHHERHTSLVLKASIIQQSVRGDVCGSACELEHCILEGLHETLFLPAYGCDRALKNPMASASYLTRFNLFASFASSSTSPDLAHLARRDRKDNTWLSVVSAGSFAAIGDLVSRVLRNFAVRHLNS